METRTHQQQQQEQQQQQALQALTESFSASIGATAPVDALSLRLEQWDALSLQQRLEAMRSATKIARIEVERALPGEPRVKSPYVVVCGRDADGRPRIVYDGTRIPPREEVEALEREHGRRAWRLAGPALGIAEETAPRAPRRSLEWAPVSGPTFPWSIPGSPLEVVTGSEHDGFYPRVRIRISAADQPYSPDAGAEFRADLDTGAQYCAFPMETGASVPGLGQVLTHAHLVAYAEHLGVEWEVWVVDVDLLRVDVEQQTGWQRVFPRNTDEHHELRFSPDWGPQHALCQVRPEREAFVGRPVWRGAVKLTLESTEADWKSAPPVTY